MTLGSKNNIWKAVKVANDLSPVGIPSNLTVGGVPVLGGAFANSFVTYFHDLKCLLNCIGYQASDHKKQLYY